MNSFEGHDSISKSIKTPFKYRYELNILGVLRVFTIYGKEECIMTFALGIPESNFAIEYEGGKPPTIVSNT